MSKTESFGVSEFFVQRPCVCEKSARVRCVATAAVLVTFAAKSDIRSINPHGVNREPFYLSVKQHFCVYRQTAVNIKVQTVIVQLFAKKVSFVVFKV